MSGPCFQHKAPSSLCDVFVNASTLTAATTHPLMASIYRSSLGQELVPEDFASRLLDTELCLRRRIN